MSKNSEYSLAIKIAGKIDPSLAKSVGNAQKTLSKVGGVVGTIAKVGAAAVTAAAGAVVAFSKASIDAGMQFDSAMSQVAATMGTTVDQIDELRQFAIDMGSKTAFSATEAAEALNYMALAGYDAKTSMAMLPNVLNLAAAGSIDLAAASDMITDAQSALGLSLEDTSVMVDQIAKTASKTNTSVEQLGEAILTVGGTAQYMSGGTAELNAVLGVLADNGIKGSEGGTHLRNMLLKLASPTAEATKLLNGMKVKVFDAEGNMRSFTDIFPELNAAMANLTAKERLDAMSTLFNSRDIASATALLSTSADRWGELSSAIGNAQGAAEAMANTQLDNLSGDITLFKSALEGAQITISDRLTPILREFVQYGTESISKFATAFNERGLSGVMDVFGEILSDGIGMISYHLQEVIEAGINLINVLGQAVIDNLPTIIDAIVDNLPLFIDAGVQLFLGLVENMPAIVDGILDALPEIVTAILNGFGALGVGLWEIFKSAWEDIKIECQPIVDYFLNIWAGIQGAFGNVTEWFHSKFTEAWTAVKNVFSSGGAIFMGIVDGILSGFKAVVNAIIGGLNRVIAIPFNGINAALSRLKNVSILGVSPFGWIQTFNVPQIPRLAKGGVVDQSTILEAGEAGPEAIIPLKELWNKMESFIDSIIGGGNSYGSPALSPAGAPSFSIIYKPEYHFGGAPSKDDMVSAERTSQEEFEKMMEKWIRDHNRKDF